MIDRREFVRRGALWTLGAALVTDLDLLDRLTWRRKSFPGASVGRITYTVGPPRVIGEPPWVIGEFRGRLVFDGQRYEDTGFRDEKGWTILRPAAA
jgi:hypothetical protein